MLETSGLQLDPRCIKCGRMPSADSTLYELRNHLFICDSCRQQEEIKGKRLEWVSGLQVDIPTPASPTIPLSRPLAGRAPSGSLYDVLGLPMLAKSVEIEDAIQLKMVELMRQADSTEKRELIERLHTWQELANSEEELDRYRTRLKPARPEFVTLSVGGRTVSSVEEFLEACEASAAGWADGERYLRSGELQHWVLFQLDDRTLAEETRRYESWKSASGFRALNQLLYRMIPQRPFRLYDGDQWQSVKGLPSAETLQQLTELCDSHWAQGERHLYEGSMLCWLEQSREIQGLQAYYDAHLAGYAKTADRGLGLELLLERASPDLTRPKLIVAFDGTVGKYQLRRWDRELPHKPITITITNATRGYTRVDLALVKPGEHAEPDWATLHSSSSLRGRPGTGMPATATIALSQLPKLDRGRTYRRELRMTEQREFDQKPVASVFPVSLKTMTFFQGYRGLLWLWGLRGNLPGLFWNCFVGAAIASFLVAFYPSTIPPGGTLEGNAFWVGTPPTHASVGAVLEVIRSGLVRSDYLAIHFVEPLFPLIVGGVLGIVGYFVGIGKGHDDYPPKQNAARYRGGAFWLSVLVVALVWHQGYGVVTALYIFLIACLIASARRRFELLLTKRHQTLLNPPGRS